MSVTTTLSGLLSRNTDRPGLVGTARVDRDIDRLLRRVCPGDIVVLDVLDLDRITADALVDAQIAAVVNASTSVSGRYPNLGPEVLVNNGVTLIDDAGPDVFKKIKDGAKVRLHNGGSLHRRPPADPRHRAQRRRDRRPDAGSQERLGLAPGSVRRQHH